MIANVASILKKSVAPNTSIADIQGRFLLNRGTVMFQVCFFYHKASLILEGVLPLEKG